MSMDSHDDEIKAPASSVMANHENGEMFSHAATGKGIQGDRHWLALGIAEDIDKCCTRDAKAQVKSDQEPSSARLREEIIEIRRARTCAQTAREANRNATATPGMPPDMYK